MIRIAICDDDKELAEKLRCFLQNKGKELGDIEMHATTYHSGEDFLQTVATGAFFHIVFMDIQMKGLDGIKTGEALRSTDDGDDTLLVYMSSYDSYYEGIAYVGSFGFIKKPFSLEKVEEIFHRAITKAQKYGKREQVFLYNVYQDKHSVKTMKIVYLKNNKRTVELYVWDEASKNIIFLDKFYSSITEILGRLPRVQFVQCERSYVVNLDYVEQMGASFFSLSGKDGVKIPIGKTMKEDVKQAYFRHRGGNE